jgi:hypothetical protein
LKISSGPLKLIFLSLLLSLPAFADEPAAGEKPESQPASEKPSYESMMFWNGVLPGTAQITLGQYGEGAFYMTTLDNPECGKHHYAPLLLLSQHPQL